MNKIDNYRRKNNMFSGYKNTCYRQQKYLYANLNQLDGDQKGQIKDSNKPRHYIEHQLYPQQNKRGISKINLRSNAVFGLINGDVWKKYGHIKAQFKNKITSHSKRNINKIRAIQTRCNRQRTQEKRKMYELQSKSHTPESDQETKEYQCTDQQYNKQNNVNFLAVWPQAALKIQQKGSKISICCPNKIDIKQLNPKMHSYRSEYTYSVDTFRYTKNDVVKQRREQKQDQFLLQRQVLLQRSFKHGKLEQNTGRVKIIEQFAQGGNSKVYKAILSTYATCYSSQEVILKKVRLDEDDIGREQFFAKRLKSPFIVDILGTYHTNVKQQQQEYMQPKQSLNLAQPRYLNIIMEKYDMNLDQLLQQSRLPPQTMKLYFYQMLRSLVYLHSLNICHRDIKPQNYLVKKWKIVLTDFGMSKTIKKKRKNATTHSNPSFVNQESQKHTTYVFARQYRAPELLLGYQQYSQSVDIWALGCLVAQMYLCRPLFNGLNNLDQLVKIMKVLGSPQCQTLSFSKNRIPNLPKINGIGLQQSLRGNKDKNFATLLQKMLQFDPKNRISALQALCSPYFDDLRDQTTYRKIFKEYNCPNFFNFTKKQTFGNQQYLGKLIPFWVKEHCRKYRIKISEIKKL